MLKFSNIVHAKAIAGKISSAVSFKKFLYYEQKQLILHYCMNAKTVRNKKTKDNEAAYQEFAIGVRGREHALDEVYGIQEGPPWYKVILIRQVRRQVQRYLIVQLVGPVNAKEGLVCLSYFCIIHGWVV